MQFFKLLVCLCLDNVLDVVILKNLCRSLSPGDLWGYQNWLSMYKYTRIICLASTGVHYKPIFLHKFQKLFRFEDSRKSWLVSQRPLWLKPVMSKVAFGIWALISTTRSNATHKFWNRGARALIAKNEKQNSELNRVRWFGTVFVFYIRNGDRSITMILVGVTPLSHEWDPQSRSSGLNLNKHTGRVFRRHKPSYNEVVNISASFEYERRMYMFSDHLLQLIKYARHRKTLFVDTL